MYCNCHEKEKNFTYWAHPGHVVDKKLSATGSTNYEAPHYAVFSSILLLYLFSPSMGSTITVPNHTNFLLHVHFPV